MPAVAGLFVLIDQYDGGSGKSGPKQNTLLKIVSILLFQRFAVLRKTKYGQYDQFFHFAFSPLYSHFRQPTSKLQPQNYNVASALHVCF